MQFKDLKAQYVVLKNEIDAEIEKVIQNTNFINGEQVYELEQQLAQYIGVKHCITCGNGTDALNLALMVWKTGAGDAVFVPDFTFFSSGEVVSYHNAVPIFVDVNEHTFNIDTVDLEKKAEMVFKAGQISLPQ